MEWITQNRKDGVLQDFLPDDDSIATLFPQLKDMNFVDGMLDGIMGASNSNEAQILFDLFCEFADANLDDALVDEYLGRIQYLNFLEAKDEQTREWLLFEGYKCDINDNYTAPLCMQKGDLLGFIKERGFDDALYDATAAMFNALMGSGNGPHKITEYEDYDETFSLFFAHSKGVQMNAQRFRILLSLNTHLEIYSEDDENDEESTENDERDFAKKYATQFLALVREIAFERDIDWQGLVLSDIFDYNHRKIAAKLGIDIWREFYTHALKNKDFNEWYELSKTRDIHRYKELCELVKSRFDLEAMKTEPKDELGMHSKFNAYRDLEMVVQGLRDFDEFLA